MEVDEIVGALSDIRNQIHKSGAWNRPQKLSEIVIKISTYLTYLGEHLPILEAAYLAKRSETYHLLLKEKSATAAENEARYATAELRRDYEKVKQFHSDFKSLTSVCQTHLRILTESERGTI